MISMDSMEMRMTIAESMKRRLDTISLVQRRPFAADAALGSDSLSAAARPERRMPGILE